MYYEFFGLRDAPFEFLPSSTIFWSDAHREGNAALEWALREPSGLTLLVGEVGTGKTMLIHSLVTRFKSDQIRIAQVGDPTMSFEQMLGSILQQLGIHAAGKGKLASLQALRTFLADPAGSHKAILIFDEAQGLSDDTLEELRLMSNSRPPQRQALQIILAGQPELAFRLSDPKLRALNQRIGARAVLRPLHGKEVHDYVNCLLRAHGARQELFSHPALDQVASLSGGLPRKINNLCHNSLLLAFLEGRPIVERRHVQAASREFDNLLDAPSHRLRIGDRAWHWMVGKRRPLMAGGASALAIVAVVLAVDFAKGRPDARLARDASVQTGSAQGADRSPKPALAHPEPLHESENAAANPAPQSNRSATIADGPPSQPPAADGSAPAASIPGTETTAGPSIVAGASPPPQTVASVKPLSAPSAVTQAPTHDRPVDTRSRRLQKEIKRARSSFQAGRYAKAIYHIKRALLLDPGNTEMSELLGRAQAAPPTPNESTAVQEEPAETASSAQEDQATSDKPAPPSAESASSFAAVVRSEISAGDAYMHEAKYDLALRKFLTAEVLDPDNANLPDRIKRAQTMQKLDSRATPPDDPGGAY